MNNVLVVITVGLLFCFLPNRLIRTRVTYQYSLNNTDIKWHDGTVTSQREATADQLGPFSVEFACSPVPPCGSSFWVFWFPPTDMQVRFIGNSTLPVGVNG